MHDHLEMILPANLELAHAVRESSKAIFKWMGFGQREIYQWELIVDELFMNAVEYGSDPKGATVYLSFQKTDEGGLFRIEDEGTGLKKISAEKLREKIKQHQKEAKLTDTSGRGLALIMEKWTDTHAIEQSSKGGILIRVEKKRVEEAMPTENPPLPSLPASAQKPVKVILVNENVYKPDIKPYLKPIQNAVDNLKNGQSIELNFEQVKYINSIFIGHLAEWYNQAHAKNAFLVLTHLSPKLKAILTLVGLNKVFNLNT